MKLSYIYTVNKEVNGCTIIYLASVYAHLPTSSRLEKVRFIKLQKKFWGTLKKLSMLNLLPLKKPLILPSVVWNLRAYSSINVTLKFSLEFATIIHDYF